MEIKTAEWKEINELFGPLVEADLKESGVILEKTVTGGLVVPKKNGFILDECRHLYRKKVIKKFTGKNDKINFYNQQMMKCRPEAYDLDDEDNFDLFVNFEQTVKVSSSNVDESSRSLSPNSQTPIKSTSSMNSVASKKNHNEKSRNTPDYINYCNYEFFDEYHPFVKNLDITDKFREFMGTQFRGYESCIPLIIPIFSKFIKKHKKFGYKYILKNIPQDKSSIDGQISQSQLQAYFRRLFYVVVPIELFGNRRNTKKILKMIKKYFQTAFGEYFSAQTVTNSLNIEAVKWLCVIENENTKISVISQLVESFFEKYIMAVLGTYMYTEKMTWSNEKIVFRLDHWLHYTKKYLAQQKSRGVYKEVTRDNLKKELPSNIPDAKLTLHIKKNGIRPILLSHPTPIQRKEVKILNILLYQLLLRKIVPLRPQNLEELWRDIHKIHSSKEDRPLYFISCDIHDAFGSIDQQKLLDIVLSMMDELEDKLVLQLFAIFKPRFSTDRYIYREYFDSPLLPLALPAHTLSCRDTSKRIKLIEKEFLKNRIQSYILKRKVSINNKLHYQVKGIGQGVPLTSLFCDIYYGDMVLKYFASFMERGHLLRYVDDFLYITDDKILAERFLETVHTGITNYNCIFNPRKTSSNLPPYCANEFIYLGYRFNIKTFNVTPEYPSVPIRYVVNLTKPESRKALSIFTNRLRNFLFLKVEKLVLDPSVNSKKSIEKTINRITILSAKRCYSFLLSIFDFKDITGSRIFSVIKNHSVNPLTNKISRLCNATNCVSMDNLNSIRKSIWRAYSKEFRGNTDLYKKLGPYIKSQLK